VGGPLDGITVVSVEQALAAPFATRQLADLGARVIKVERPGKGDFAREYDHTVKGLASYFVWANRSKQSLSLDLKQPEGIEILTALVSTADVFVQNLAPGAAFRLGFGADVLRARDPRLIVCDISGYGGAGPYRDRRAYDLLVQTEAGLLSVTGTAQDPAKVGISVADISAGMYAYSAILTALFTRERSGLGAALEVSLFDSLTEWMSQPLYYAMYTGSPPARTGSSHATIAPYGTFRTGDGGSVQLAVQNDREWRRLCSQVLGDHELADDPRYLLNPLRVANRDDLVTEIERRLGVLTADEVIDRLERAQIAYGRFAEVVDLLDHPQLEASNRWTEVDSSVGMLRALLPPVRMSGVEPVMGRIPDVGEDTEEVLSGIGYGAKEIGRLREAGTI
jgi:itaconate CoA-transferase